MGARLSAGALDDVASPVQLFHQQVAVVALDFDDGAFDGSAGPALLLELCSQPVQPLTGMVGWLRRRRAL